jgi:hypothetical protein
VVVVVVVAGVVTTVDPGGTGVTTGDGAGAGAVRVVLE